MKKVHGNSVIKNFIIALVLSGVYLVLFCDNISFKGVSDSLFIVGIVFLILGLFRITRTLKFYNLLIFGWKKLIEIIVTRNYSKRDSKTGEYFDYQKESEYNKPYAEFIITGLTMIIVSTFIAFKG